MRATREKKKITKTTKKRWARYALPEGFAERGYPKDTSCHTINKSMMGRKNPRYGYQTTCKHTNTQRNKSNDNAKFAVIPHQCSAVLIKYSTQRFHQELGRTREPIRKKFSLNIQKPSVTRRNKVMRTEERRNSALLHTTVECNQKICRRRLRRVGNRCFFGWPSSFGPRGRGRENKA
jgi:hypothetical protein